MKSHLKRQADSVWNALSFADQMDDDPQAEEKLLKLARQRAQHLVGMIEFELECLDEEVSE